MNKPDFFDLVPNSAKHIVAVYNERPITVEEFLQHVRSLARDLPNHRYAVNLCQDRYRFLVAFAALMLRQQTNLLPPNHAIATIHEVAADFRDCYCLTDHDIEALEIPVHKLIQPLTSFKPDKFEIPRIAGDHIACIVFTSGSTGKPTANIKRWGELVPVAKATQHWLNIKQNSNLTLVATVPPQHMYGLETTIMLPLIAGAKINHQKPFFPEDIRNTLVSQKTPTALITTPIHLRTCVESDIDWPAVDFILSATAPLSRDIAQHAERRFSTQVLEIYGCSESGSIAHRHTTKSDAWTLYAGMDIRQQADNYYVNSYHLPEAVCLNDNLELIDQEHFYLLDRKSDLVIIAGKRASLADMNKKLLDINGIIDGVIFLPEHEAGQKEHNSRLVAFVVAPLLDESTITAELRKHVDDAFLPRPIYKLDKLPRESTSKLPRKNLISTLKQLRNTS